MHLLQLQIGICVQGVSFEYITGFDGLHQTEVIRVYDSGGQTLHHSHSYQSGIHDRTDGLRHTVTVVGKSAGGVQSHISEHLDALKNFHLFVLHSFNNQEQRIEPEILSFHTVLQTSLQKHLAVTHTLVVVFCDSFAVAKRDYDCIVSSCQINVLDSSCSISGVYNRFSFASVVNSLNLTGADVVIHYDPWWNVAAENQATDRAHRIGQKRVVTVYKLVAEHTIEEKVVELQQKKKELADQVLSGEEMGSILFDREELLKLFQN